MPETNFLSSIQEQENNPPAVVKKLKKKTPRKISKSPINEDKSLFKLKGNLNIKPAIPKAKFKIEKKSSNANKSEARNIYRKISFSFVALTVILVAAVLYFGFSKVTLVIIPTQEKINDSMSLEIIDKVDGSVVGQGQIKGIVRQVPVEQERTFAASGKEVLGEDVSGKVTIINNYMKNQPLVATTRLLTADN